MRYVTCVRDPTRLRLIPASHELALLTYRITRSLPKEEMYGLQSQMRRASVSVATNIAEGHGRGSDGDFERHLRIASGSLAELDALSLICRDLEMLPRSDHDTLREASQRVGRMLTRLTQRVASDRATPRS